MGNIRWGILSAIFAIGVCVILGILSGVQPIHIFIRSLIFMAVFFGVGFGLRFLVNNFLPEILIEEEAVQQEPPGARVNITVDSVGEYAVPELFKVLDNSQELGNIEDLISGAFRAGMPGRIAVNAENAGKPETTKPPKQWFESSMTEETIDRKKEAGYNDIGSFQSIFENPMPVQEPAIVKKAEQPNFTPSFGDDSGLGGLPDLDMMARAFSSGGENPISMPIPPESGSSAGFSGSFEPVSAPSFVPSIPVFGNDEPVREQLSGNKPQTLEGFDPKRLAQGISTILSKN